MLDEILDFLTETLSSGKKVICCPTLVLFSLLFVAILLFRSFARGL